MPTFNLRVAVRFDGESAKIVEQAFKDMGHKVDTHLGSVSKSVKSFERDLKGLKKLLGGALIGKVALDAGVEAIKALDRHFKILGSSGKDALASFDAFASSVSRLDVSGAAAELGKLIAQMYALSQGPWGSGISQTAEEERRLAAEFAKNIENARKNPKFRGEEARRALAEQFGDPKELVAKARKLGEDIHAALNDGGSRNQDLEGGVRRFLDQLETAGVAAPIELQKVAKAWGVVSTATEAATKKAIESSKRRAAQLEEEAEKIRRAFDTLVDRIEEESTLREARLAEGIEILDAAYANKLIPTLEEYERLVSRLKLTELEDLARQKVKLIDRLADNIQRELTNKVDWTVVPEAANIELKYLSVDVQNALTAAGEGFLQTWGAAFGNAVYAAFNGGDVVDAFVDTLKQGLAGTLAQLFGDLAVMFGKELVKQLAAAKGVNAVDSGGNLTGGGWAAALKVAWPVLAIAAVGVAAKYFATRNDGKRYTSSAGVAYTETAGLKGGYGSLLGTSNSQTQRAIEESIIGLLKAFQSSTGAYIKGMENISVLIRHDKRGYMVGEQIFATMNEAIIAAAKKAFLSADLSGELDPILRSVIENFRGADPEALIAGLDYVKRILNEASGLSGIDLQIKGLPESIAAVRQNLLDLGLTLSEAWATSAKWGVAQFQNAWRDLSGQELSPKEELAQKKASAELLVAQINLWKLELLARKAYLEGQLGLARIEFGGGGGGAGGSGGIRRTVLNAQAAFLKSSAAIATAEVQMQGQYLKAKSQFVSAQAQLYQAELDVINQALVAIDKLLGTININKIKLSGGRVGKVSVGNFGGSSFGDDGSSLMTGALSPLSPERQLAFAKQYLEGQIASKGDVSGARDRYLEAAQKMYGNTSAYAAIFEDTMRKTSDFGSFFDQQQMAQQKATSNLLLFSSATYKASKAMASLGGFQISASGGGGSGSGGLSGGSVSPASGSGGGLLGGGGLIGAISGGAARTVEALGEVATAVQTAQRTRTTTTTTAPAPVPPPPPGGTTTVYDGGGLVGSIDRSFSRVA